MKHDELDEEFQNTFGYSGRCEGYDDDNMEQMLLEDEEDDIWSKKRKPATQSANQKEGCYIATCVYGSYDCPEVWTLRRFRDYKLASSWLGRSFIHTYYVISPTIVRWFGKTKWFNHFWKGKLDRMANHLQKKGYQDTPYYDR